MTGVVLFFTTALVDGTVSSGSCLMPAEELKVTIGFFTSHSTRLTFKSEAIEEKKKKYLVQYVQTSIQISIIINNAYIQNIYIYI